MATPTISSPCCRFINVTPCVSRLVSRIACKSVRSTMPEREISMIWSSGEIVRAATIVPVLLLRLSVRDPKP